jgi:hypothetical protein
MYVSTVKEAENKLICPQDVLPCRCDDYSVLKFVTAFK